MRISAGPARAIHRTSQPGAKRKAGRTGSLNFPECVRWGRGGRAGLGAISHASPPRRESAAHSPAPGLPAGWGARVAGEGALAAHGGGEGRKLSKEGQKGWGRRNWLFLLLFFWFFVFSNKRFLENRSFRGASLPTVPSPRRPHAPTFCNLSPKSHLGDWWPRRRRTRTSSHVSRGAGGPPLPHGGRGPGSAGTRVPSGGDPGAHRRSRSSAARAWGLGLERARRAGGSRPARTCGPLSSSFALLGRRETQPQGAWHSRGARAAVPGSAPVACLSGTELPFCHRGCCRAGGGGARGLRHRPDGRPPARWLLGELAPGTPPPHFRIRSYGGSHPAPGVPGSRSYRSPEKVTVSLASAPPSSSTPCLLLPTPPQPPPSARFSAVAPAALCT